MLLAINKTKWHPVKNVYEEEKEKGERGTQKTIIYSDTSHYIEMAFAAIYTIAELMCELKQNSFGFCRFAR